MKPKDNINYHLLWRKSQWLLCNGGQLTAPLTEILIIAALPSLLLLLYCRFLEEEKIFVSIKQNVAWTKVPWHAKYLRKTKQFVKPFQPVYTVSGVDGVFFSKENRGKNLFILFL